MSQLPNIIIMRKTTNITELKNLALSFLYLEPTYDEILSFIVIHPFFENAISFDAEGNMIDIHKPEDMEKFRDMFKYRIEKSNDLFQLLTIIRKPYRFTFLKFAKPYLSKQDFDKALAETWISSENPNQDANVPISQFIRWFNAANKNTIMTKEDHAYYDSLPDTVDIYRGVAVGRADKDGLSWTHNPDTAKWFAHRFDTDSQQGYVLHAQISKSDIFAYFNTRNEDELVCNSKKISIVNRIT